MIFIGAILMVASGDFAAAAKPDVSVLPNGLQVVFQHDERFPLVSVRMYVRAGSVMEEPEQAGISHLLEHMVFKGREAQDGAAERVEAVGGYINAATSFDYTMYMLDLPDEHLGLGLSVLKDMIFEVTIDPEEMERERKVVISELERGEDSPTSLLFKKTQGLVWKGTGYELPIIGSRETLASLTPKNIEDYVAKHYQPQSMVLVVVGNVGKDQAMGLINDTFGGLRNNRTIAPPQPVSLESAGQGPRVETHTGPWNKVYASCAFPLPSLKAEETTALETLGFMLGGDETSLLYRRFKYELRLVDDISAGAMTMDRTGMLYIRAVLDPDKVDAFWEELNRILSGVSAEAFTQGDLDRAVTNIEDSLFSSKETLGGLAAKVGYFQFFEGDIRAEDNYLYDLRHLSLKQIGESAGRYLRLGSMSSVLLTPEATEAMPEPEALAQAARELWPEERKAVAEDHEPAQTVGGAETLELTGGRKLVLIPDKTLPYVSLRMVYTGGNTLLTPETQGLAAMAAEALTRGTANLSATEYQDYLSERAAGLSAASGSDVFVVSTRFPVRFQEDMFGLFQETIAEPAFADDEITRVREEQASDIKRTEDRPLGLAFRRMFPFLFPDSSYGYSRLGTLETLEGLDKSDVALYWERQRSQSWVLAVCGDFDRERVIELAKGLARDAQAAEAEFPTPQWTGDDELALTLPGRNQTHILAVFPVPGKPDPDNPSLRLLRKALTGQGGVLFSELREKKGLGYSVSAMLWQTQHTGFLAFYIGTSPDKAPQALQGFKTIAAQLGEEPLSDEQLSRAKNLIKGEYYRDIQSLSARSHEAAGLSLRGLPLEFNRDTVDKARALTAEDLRQTAAKYLDWDRAYLVRIDPEG
jgi:zinc protease